MKMSVFSLNPTSLAQRESSSLLKNPESDRREIVEILNIKADKYKDASIKTSIGVVEDHDGGFLLYTGERPNPTFRVGYAYPKVRSKVGFTGGEAPDGGTRINTFNSGYINDDMNLIKKRYENQNTTRQSFSHNMKRGIVERANVKTGICNSCGR